MHPGTALFRFQLHTAVRLAQRLFMPLTVAFVVVLLWGFEFVISLSGALLSGGLLLSALPSAAAAVTAAASAARPVRMGSSGWMRHLPVSGITVRRSAILAVWIAQVPLLLTLAALALVAARRYAIPVFPYVAGLPVLGGGAPCIARAAQDSSPPAGRSGRPAGLLPERVFARRWLAADHYR
jgi:hypothetical protein